MYFDAIAKHLGGEREALLGELAGLRKHVDHVKRVITMQNSFARIGDVAEEVVLGELIDEAIALGCPHPDRHGIHIERRVPAEIRAVVDRHRVLQILVNLLANARDAVKAGTEPARVTIECTASDGWIRISVADSGIGIAPDSLVRIFQAGFTTKPKGHGACPPRRRRCRTTWRSHSRARTRCAPSRTRCTPAIRSRSRSWTSACRRASLRAEKTTVFEGELGYELTDHMFVAANAFDITIRKPIVYPFDQATMTEGYRNFDRTGTRGVELDYRVKYRRGYARLSYSYYTAAGKNAVSAYAVPGRDDVLLAFPAHKLTASTRVDLVRGLALTPSAVIYGERHGFTTTDASGMPAVGTDPPAVLVNLYARYRDLGVKGLALGAGVFDVADRHPAYLQPYDVGHAPLPGPGREMVVRLGYERAL